MFVVWNALSFQIGWLVSVSERGVWSLLLTLFLVASHLIYCYRMHRINFQSELFLLLTLIFLGASLEAILIGVGAYQPINNDWFVPLWLLQLWCLFATTLNHSLNWLFKRGWIASGAGLLLVFPSYWAAQKLGAITLQDNWVFIGVGWSFVLTVVTFYKRLVASGNDEEIKYG